MILGFTQRGLPINQWSSQSFLPDNRKLKVFPSTRQNNGGLHSNAFVKISTEGRRAAEVIGAIAHKPAKPQVGREEVTGSILAIFRESKLIWELGEELTGKNDLLESFQDAGPSGLHSL